MESQNNITPFGECRCCLSKGNHRELHKEYYLNGRREVFIDVFMECFNLFLSTDPQLSTRICAVCIKRLQDAQSFRKLVVDNEKHLLESLTNENQTEFVNVALDPLVDDAGLQREIKSEKSFVISDDEDESEDLIPGEKILLQRFAEVKSLPTRESLAKSNPMYYAHLEVLKDTGTIESAQAPQETTRTSQDELKEFIKEISLASDTESDNQRPDQILSEVTGTLLEKSDISTILLNLDSVSLPIEMLTFRKLDSHDNKDEIKDKNTDITDANNTENETNKRITKRKTKIRKEHWIDIKRKKNA